MTLRDDETRPAGEDASPVGLVCGNGMLPLQVLDVVQAKGRKAIVIAIKSEADPKLVPVATAELGWGEIGKLFKTLHAHKCRDVVLIGGVTRRPDFGSILGDLGTLRRLPKIIKAMTSGGDDNLLTRVIRLFEEEGIRIVGMKDVAPELLTQNGLLAGNKPTDAQKQDIDAALKAVHCLGVLDIGQAAVCVAGRVIAVEGAEGTDAMLERCAELRQNGRVRSHKCTGVLVKISKPSQDLRVDLPTIGPRTVELAAQAQLAGIAIEAGRSLVSEKQQTLQAAERAGLFIWGLDTSTASVADETRG